MEKFRQQIVDIFNTSKLPLDAKFYVFKDIFYEVNELYKNILKQQEEQDAAQENNESAAADSDNIDDK